MVMPIVLVLCGVESSADSALESGVNTLVNIIPPKHQHLAQTCPVPFVLQLSVCVGPFGRLCVLSLSGACAVGG